MRRQSKRRLVAGAGALAFVGFGVCAMRSGHPRLYVGTPALAESAVPISPVSSGSELDRAVAVSLEQMVSEQIEKRGIKDRLVLSALRNVPRDRFVPDRLRGVAFSDGPLPIGFGQTISQPYVVALMTELAELHGGERVLEIGTGSAYQAAVLAKIAKEVYTIEIVPALAETAERRLRELGVANVHTKNGDGFFGWPEAAPFDTILITAAASYVPPPLLRQLKEGGRLIVPLGDPHFSHTLTTIAKVGGRLRSTAHASVRFVPMTGQIERSQQ
jgi:protein-L-isoaspartate(D-aspartate) O-methyltransferase